jgi:hypothetical protein
MVVLLPAIPLKFRQLILREQLRVPGVQEYSPRQRIGKQVPAWTAGFLLHRRVRCRHFNEGTVYPS